LIYHGADSRVIKKCSSKCSTIQLLRFGVLSRRSRYIISWVIRA
jgi:hypothetical protein